MRRQKGDIPMKTTEKKLYERAFNRSIPIRELTQKELQYIMQYNTRPVK